MDETTRKCKGAALRLEFFPGRELGFVLILSLLVLFGTYAGANVLTDPSGNTLSQYAVTSGGNVATGGGGYTLTSAVGLISGPVSATTTGDALFHGVPGPLFTSGPGSDVDAITRVGSERTNAAAVQFTVTFSEAVTGVDSTDFHVATTGTLAGYGISAVSADSGATRTVTVNTGTGDGVMRLDIVDNDTIKNASLLPLGGVGIGNGDYIGGQTYSVDKTLPTGTILINGNRSATNNRSVNLALTWTDGTGLGVSRMRFSDDGSHWTAWETLLATRAWTLPVSADGHKTVSAQFLDKANNYSPVYHDYIRLDTTLPTGTIIINGGAATTPTRSVTLNLSWFDAGAQVSRMRFSDDGAHWTWWMLPKASQAYTLPDGLGNHTVRVQYLDGANNYSATYNDYIKLVAP